MLTFASRSVLAQAGDASVVKSALKLDTVLDISDQMPKPEELPLLLSISKQTMEQSDLSSQPVASCSSF